MRARAPLDGLRLAGTPNVKSIAKAIRDVRVDYPAIEPGVAHESVPFAKAVLDALDKANLEIVPKDENNARR